MLIEASKCKWVLVGTDRIPPPTPTHLFITLIQQMPFMCRCLEGLVILFWIIRFLLKHKRVGVMIILIASIGYCNCAEQGSQPWRNKPPMQVRAYPMPDGCNYRLENCMIFPLPPAHAYGVGSNFSLPCQLVQQTFVQVPVYWYKLKPDGTLTWMDAQRRNENLHTTFLEFRDAKWIMKESISVVS